MINLQELPRFSDKRAYLYVEHAVIEQEDKAIAVFQTDGVSSVPVAALAVLLLGPGTKISHAAIRTLADNNCLVCWTGEQGVRFYAQGLGGSRHSRNLLHQAALLCNEITRLQVVVRMYCMRFAEPVDLSLTLQQLRGKEGIRIREAYAAAARHYGIEWKGRSYTRDQWDGADPVNRALSCANACLYGLAHAAILAGGWSPALGFIHTGKQLSFVYDIADLYKTRCTVPVAFRIAAENPPDLERRVRLECRDVFHQERLMERMVPDIARLLDLKPAEAQAPDIYAEDPAAPSELWEPPEIAAMPVGQLLSLSPSSWPGRKNHDRPSGGESSTITAR